MDIDLVARLGDFARLDESAAVVNSDVAYARTARLVTLDEELEGARAAGIADGVLLHLGFFDL